MAELFLMASNGCPRGSSGALFHPQQALSVPLKDLNQISFQNQRPTLNLINPYSMDDLGLRLEAKDSNGSLIMAPSPNCPLLPDDDEMLLFGFEIANRCIRQQAILNLLASSVLMGKGNDESGLLLRGFVSNFGNCRPVIDHLLPPTSDPSWRFTNPESKWHSLAYPVREFYFNSPKLVCHCDGTEMNASLRCFQPKTTTKSSNQTMLVPYFERRRRSQPKIESSPKNIKNEQNSKNNSQQQKGIQKKKATSSRITYLHACETLLSLITFDRERQARSAVLSLKKSGTGAHLALFLNQVSGSIAGTGIAVVLSVAYGVACRGAAFRGTKFWSTGIGLGLVWLSWAVNKLRDTVMRISRAPGKLEGGEEKSMMEYLDRSLKNVYLGVAALAAFAFLRLA